MAPKYTLRHALATRADQDGAALGDIFARLGHKRTRITHTYLIGRAAVGMRWQQYIDI